MDSNFKESIEYWRDDSSQDFKVAKSLFEKKFYAHSLFFCHLSLEKLLKSFVMKKAGKFAPHTHDLLRLAEVTGIKLDKEQTENLEKIFTFNVAGRYPEEKIDFYKKYNKKDFAQKYLKITNDLLLWLKKEFQKKQ